MNYDANQLNQNPRLILSYVYSCISCPTHKICSNELSISLEQKFYDEISRLYDTYNVEPSRLKEGDISGFKAALNALNFEVISTSDYKFHNYVC